MAHNTASVAPGQAFIAPPGDSGGQFIYIHVPFCEQKCAYCDFFTVRDDANGARRASEWMKLIAREMELWTDAGDLSRETPIQTIFFGGGTPSLANAAAVEKLLDFARSHYNLALGAEITMEMQPNTADGDKVRALAKAGVNRFSIGAQTFREESLRRAGRRHTVEQTKTLFREASRAGTASLDLIACWPDQTMEAWRADLDEALALGPDHISVYELTFHAGTEFHRQLKSGRIESLDEELRLAMFEETDRVLCAAGFEHYEISNYARPGARSRHNENYWTLGNFVGLGAGAHSFIFPHRYTNAASIASYEKFIGRGELFRRPCDAADPEIFAVENLQMALRLAEGVDLDWFAERFGMDIRQRRPRQMENLQREGLLKLQGARASLTSAGVARFDSVIEFLL
ncbi:MAG: radical SAM family heme chaperone HemW [Candidatus Sumerlaeaceae bacterium]|nr:radical SAM family heme chaperone HemW [Candidatus Sumerlaeaceae bacterium]